MKAQRFIVETGNLSAAWSQVLLRLLEPGVQDLAPVVVSVSDFDSAGEPSEMPGVRSLVDDALRSLGKNSVRTVANTIFPSRLWRPGLNDDEDDLYQRYQAIWPKVAACPLNRHGVYFRRLTSFQAVGAGKAINQLRIIINCLKQGKPQRRSALQAAVFDPSRDHRPDPYLSFPCLQQVAFARIGEDGLSVTGFYTLQHQLTKAYGNYLGLCQLGRFVAHQADLRLVQANCMASAVTIGAGTKGGLGGLKAALVELVPASSPNTVLA